MSATQDTLSSTSPASAQSVVQSSVQLGLVAALRQVLGQLLRLLEEPEPSYLLKSGGPLEVTLSNWRKIISAQTSEISQQRAHELENAKLHYMGKAAVLEKECADLRVRNEELREEIVRLNKREDVQKKKVLDLQFISKGHQTEAKQLDMEVRDLRRRIRSLEGGPPLTAAEAAPQWKEQLEPPTGTATPGAPTEMTSRTAVPPVPGNQQAAPLAEDALSSSPVPPAADPQQPPESTPMSRPVIMTNARSAVEEAFRAIWKPAAETTPDSTDQETSSVGGELFDEEGKATATLSTARSRAASPFHQSQVTQAPVTTAPAHREQEVIKQEPMKKKKRAVPKKKAAPKKQNAAQKQGAPKKKSTTVKAAPPPGRSARKKQGIAENEATLKKEAPEKTPDAAEKKTSRRSAKKAATQKSATKKTAPKKAAPKKATPKKAAPKKAAPKNTAMKKAPPSPRTSKKTSGSPLPTTDKKDQSQAKGPKKAPHAKITGSSKSKKTSPR